MADAQPTEYLAEKINTLKSQIQQSAMNVFVQQLVVDDSNAGTTNNQQIDEMLQSQAQSAMAQVTMETRKLATRRALLITLQAEWNKLQDATAPAA